LGGLDDGDRKRSGHDFGVVLRRWFRDYRTLGVELAELLRHVGLHPRLVLLIQGTRLVAMPQALVRERQIEQHLRFRPERIGSFEQGERLGVLALLEMRVRLPKQLSGLSEGIVIGSRRRQSTSTNSLGRSSFR